MSVAEEDFDGTLYFHIDVQDKKRLARPTKSKQI